MAVTPERRARFSARATAVALAALVLLGLAAAIGLARRGPLDVEGEAPPDGLFRAAGAVHVHTTLSDGGGPPEEVVAAARAAGLAFVAITDHNNLDAKPVEGYRDGVLVLVGTELSTTAGHVVGLGIPDPVFRFSGDALDGLEDIRDLGGISFAAHPLSPRDDLRWTGWDLAGPWGLELLNGDSEVRAAGARLLATAALYLVDERKALLQSLEPPDAALARWDALLRERPVPGIAGADAHSRLALTARWTVRFPSYRSIFAVIRNHVLLPVPLAGKADADARLVLDALGRGRSYVGLDAIAPAGEVFFTVEGNGRRWTMGDAVPFAPGLELRAGGRWPRGARLTLLRDGTKHLEADGPIRVAVPGPGVYRIEIRVPGWRIPWVLTNPIHVFDEATLRRRAARAAWPEPTAPPAPVELIDDFDGGTVFRSAARPEESLEPGILDLAGGRDGGGAARLAFHIAAPAPQGPPPYCAIVNREERDLSGRRGLTFSIQADGVYRIWVQVRDFNPAAGDEATEWWYASARTATEWRRVALPFARFRSFNPATDGRLDLDKVRGIAFVLEPATVKPGTRGVIWIDEVGVY
jgi:hypothetical protein